MSNVGRGLFRANTKTTSFIDIYRRTASTVVSRRNSDSGINQRVFCYLKMSPFKNAFNHSHLLYSLVPSNPPSQSNFPSYKSFTAPPPCLTTNYNGPCSPCVTQWASPSFMCILINPQFVLLSNYVYI